MLHYPTETQANIKKYGKAAKVIDKTMAQTEDIPSFKQIIENAETPEELKQLYGDRWTVEKDYDRLKNKLYIEKFTGRRRTIIEQDFYSHIYLFNILIALKNDAEQQITRKPKETTKYKYKYFA